MSELARPMPQKGLIESFSIRLEPALGIYNWVNEHIISEQGVLHNPDHQHLADADIKFLWASCGFNKQGRTVLGTCEQVMFRAGGWQKARAEQQMADWFGGVPAFLITLDASFCAECSDLEFCALVEHELYHIAQATDEFGLPKFSKEGMPKLKLRGHDVEEFTGVVRRYGASEQVKEMASAATNAPEVGKIDIHKACGTCILKLA